MATTLLEYFNELRDQKPFFWVKEFFSPGEFFHFPHFCFSGGFSFKGGSPGAFMGHLG